MVKKYYKYDAGGMAAPNAGVPMHAQREGGRKADADGEVIKPRPLFEASVQEKAEKETSLLSSLFKNGKVLGRYEADDIMILCIIFLLLQDKEELDIPLLLALGYIFLSDKDFSVF